jgi:hypothetical protein
MKRALVVLALLSFSGCETAAKYPGTTIGTVTGTMTFGLCELSVARPGTCLLIGGAAGLALGGITALVNLLANTNAPVDPAAQEEQQREYVTEPPPGLPEWMRTDAGVPPPVAPTVDAAVVDSM